MNPNKGVAGAAFCLRGNPLNRANPTETPASPARAIVGP